MTNLEKYKDEIKSGIKKGDALKCVISDIALKYGGKGNEHKCDYDLCSKCVLESVDWLCEEHKEIISLKQWEYDFISCLFDNNKITKYRAITDLIERGHFKGIANLTEIPKVKEILSNCKIVADDYDFGGNEKE